MSRTSLALVLLVLLTSLTLLSLLSMVLTGYPEAPRPLEPGREEEGEVREEEPSILLFKISPATPQLYWRIWSADFYTGSHWQRTTDENVVNSFPRIEDANATRIFTVEINATQSEFFLPLASPNSIPANMSLASIVGLKFYGDTVGNAFRATVQNYAEGRQLTYNVPWSDSEIDDRLISLDAIPDEILERYLQLPDMPSEVLQLAGALEDPSYSVLDQILADVQYFRTNFVYDFERLRDAYQVIVGGSEVSSYIERGKGTCMDAATALAIILRIQKIPARMSVGYRAERLEGGKLLYYTTGAHSVTEVYLNPYGWIQFDATPPLEEDPLVRVLPIKKVSSPGSRLFYELSVTNRRDSTDNLKLFVESRENWSIRIAPNELRIEANQSADALLEVEIPDEANLGDKNLVTVTAAFRSDPDDTFSAVAITQVDNILQISTETSLRNMDQTVFRGDTFWVNGTVLAASNGQVDNMTLYVFLTNNRAVEDIIVGKGYSTRGDFTIESSIPISAEIGDYELDVISVGKEQYAPSNDTSPIIVRATTRIEFSSEEELPLGYGAIHGHLLWDNGTGFARVPVSFEISSVSTPSETSRFQNLTFDDGSFRIETSFENSGVYEVKAMYSGNEYILGSDATHKVKLERGTPAIQVFAESTAVRGKVFNVTGAIRFGDVGVWGEPIAVSLDNQLLATIETRDKGSYSYSFVVDTKENLGLHFIGVALEKSDVSATHNIMVKSKTTLTTSFSQVAGGMFFLYSASLSDDHGVPIQEAEIIVEDYRLGWKTDANGDVTFLLDAISFWPENLSLTARFEGSQLYLPVSTQEKAVFEPVISLPFLIPIISPFSVIFVLVSVNRLVRKRRALQQTSVSEISEEKQILHTQEEFQYEPQEMQPLKIVLLDVEAKFPNVWGAGDELRMEIALDRVFLGRMHSREVEVLIDEETVAHVGLSHEGRTQFSHVFTEKGDHKVLAVLPTASSFEPWRAEIRLRIVDYGEEVIRLYNEFLGKLANHGIPAQGNMTAREIENRILNMSGLSTGKLRDVTNCFEKAEYSNHPVTRKDYEILYLSLVELSLNV